MFGHGEDAVDGLAQEVLARAVSVAVQLHQDAAQVQVADAGHGRRLGAQHAVAEAAATVVGVDAFRVAIAAEAVRALVVAGLLEEADAPQAIEVLVDAELITTDAFQEATDAADSAAAELAAGW